MPPSGDESCENKRISKRLNLFDGLLHQEEKDQREREMLDQWEEYCPKRHCLNRDHYHHH